MLKPDFGFVYSFVRIFIFFSCASSPFSSDTPTCCQTQTFVFFSTQLIRSIRRHTHISKGVQLFLSVFFSGTLQTNDLINCTFSFSLISVDFQMSIRGGVTPLSTASRAHTVVNTNKLHVHGFMKSYYILRTQYMYF